MDLGALKFGYSTITTDHQAIYQQALSASSDFFQQPEHIKQSFSSSDFETGYRKLPNKESYMIKNKVVTHQLQPCLQYIDLLHQLAKKILVQVAQQLELPPSCFTNIMDQDSSLLRLLHYQGTPSHTMGCDIHQDLGLITLVNRANIPALEIYDFTEQGEWVAIEESLTENSLIIMVGESLSTLSNHYFLSATHRVKAQPGRLSMVYQVRIKPQQLLNSKDFTSSVTGKHNQVFSLTGQEFYDKEIKVRTSVNGSY